MPLSQLLDVEHQNARLLERALKHTAIEDPTPSSQTQQPNCARQVLHETMRRLLLDKAPSHAHLHPAQQIALIRMQIPDHHFPTQYIKTLGNLIASQFWRLS